MARDCRLADIEPNRPRNCRIWSEKRRGAFLDHLAATCNVRAASGAVNVWPSTAYRLRRADADFAAAWSAALLTGYDRLEAKLLQRAGAATADAEGAVEDGAFDPDLAMQLLRLHDARMKARAAGTEKLTSRVRRATPEETDAAILKQLAALDKRIKAKRGA